MIFTADKLKEARDAGYSDDEIFSFASQSDPKFNDAKSEGYSLDEIASYFSTQQPEPMIDRVNKTLEGVAFDLEDTIGIIGRIPEALATQLPAGYQRLVSGTAIPKKNEAIEADLAFQARNQKELEDRKASGELGPMASATMQMLPSIGTSLYSMGAGIAGGAVGLARGLGNPITAAADAGVASGVVSYRMQGADYLYRAFKQLEENKGSSLTDQEKTDAYKVLLPLSQESALWEAGPEAVGNAVSLGVGKFVFGFGKQAATQIARESAQAVEKTLARKIAEKSAAVVGGSATEVGTETITAIGQYAPEMAAKQYAETGTTKGAPTEYPGGIMQAAKDVAPATLATQALFMGAGGAVKLAGLPFEAKPKTPVQIATDNIDLRANKEATNLAIDPTDEAGKGLSETINSIQSNLVNKKEVYSVLEATDPAAQTLKLEIQEDENRLILMQAELNKRAGVEITEAEKQQIELAKEIAAPEVAAPVTEVVAPEITPAPTEVTPTEVAVAEAATPAVNQEFKDELEMSGVAYDGDTRYSVQQSSNGTFRAERIVNGQKEDIQIGLPDIETAQNVILDSVGKEITPVAETAPVVKETPASKPSGMSVEESKAYLEERNKSTIFGYPTEDIMARQQGKQVGRAIPAPVAETPAVTEAPAAEVVTIQRDVNKPEQMTPEEFTAKSTQEIKAVGTERDKLFILATKEYDDKRSSLTKKNSAALKRISRLNPNGGNESVDPNIDSAGKRIVESLFSEIEARKKELSELQPPIQSELFDAAANKLGYQDKRTLRQIVSNAITEQKPVSSQAVDTYGITLPEGYTKQGDLYVYQPAVSETITKPKLGEKGGVLIPSREDFIQAGQNIYEKGMEFGAWAKQMIQQFGDVVREFLGDVWQAVSGAPAKLNELMGYLPGKGEAGAVHVGRGEKQPAKVTEPEAPIEPEAETITEAMAQGLDIGKEDNMPINNKIESHIKNFAVVRGFFESASDRLRRAGFKKLATAIDDYYDQAQRRLGFANKILLPAFDEYAKQSKANKKKIDEEVKMFYAAQENKRDTAEFFDELNPITQKIVTAWQKFGEESGKDNQRIGIKVFDRGLQRYRPIGRIQKFFPRILKPEYKRALMEPDKYQKEYNEIVDALIKSGRIEKPEEAERYISNYEGTGTQKDYFSGIESARGQALPEELYDYSMQVMTDYVARWSQHASRIEQFGQKLGENSMTLWDRSRASTRDRRTIDYITAAQERVEGYFPNDPFQKGMAALNIWASGLQLGNPASATMNMVGGTTLNAMIGQPGAASSYVESLIELRKLGSNLQDAREKGIISRDLMNIVGDHQEVLDQSGIARVGQKTADFLLKWSGFTPVEQMIRTQSLIIGKSFLRKMLSSFAKNPDSSYSRQASTFLSRNNFDIDKLLVEQGSGPETDRLMRYYANISQGSYTITQNPIFIDTPIGKFLFKYQKFSTQVMRQAWKNTFEPAWKAVTFKGETMQLPSETRQLLYRLRLAEAKEIGDNRKISLDEIPQKVSKAEAKALTLIPVMMWLASAYVGGEAILRLRDVLFGVMMKGPDYEDILKALEDDEDDDELYLGLQRAWYNLIGIGALGLIGNYGQFFMDWQDRERVKNPLDPPALSLLKETGTLITNVADQGTLTKGDINNYLNRMSSMYRVSQKLYQTSASGLGFSDAPTVAEEMYRREVADINKYARRWAESAGLEYRTKRPMDIAPSKMTPINREISSYLQRNDPVTAAAYAKEYLKTLPKADRKNAIQSMESGARNRQPLRLGSGPMDEAEKRAFLKWAKTKMSPEKYAGIEKLAKQYESNRKKFLMRLPNR